MAGAPSVPGRIGRRRSVRFGVKVVAVAVLLMFPWLLAFVMVAHLHVASIEYAKDAADGTDFEHTQQDTQQHRQNWKQEQQRRRTVDQIAQTLAHVEDVLAAENTNGINDSQPGRPIGNINGLASAQEVDAVLMTSSSPMARPVQHSYSRRKRLREQKNLKSQQQQQQQQPSGIHASASYLSDPELQPILETLRQAAYNISDPAVFSEDVVASLPRWSQIQDLYGPPKIYGLETCETFRKSVPPADRITAPAGSFNSGTNVLSNLLLDNCYNFQRQEKYGLNNGQCMEWQVPWGKHFPASFRLKHSANRYRNVDQTAVMPVVTVRDPYTWMQSMCRQNYGARFEHAVHGLCPNLIPYPSDLEAHPRFKKFKYMPIYVKYTSNFTQHHVSLANMWNEWYTEYYRQSEFPHLIVRMEDLLFRGKETIKQICECVGGTMPFEDDFIHFRDVANQNSGIELGNSIHHGLLRSLVRYGNRTTRSLGYPDFQLQAARDLLDKDMMDAFGYTHVPMTHERNVVAS